MLGEMVESCAPSGCRACSVRVAILRCHSTLRWYFFAHQQLCFKVHTYTQENTCMVRECVKNSKQRREGIISFYTPPSGGRPMLPGNIQNSMVRAGFSSERKAQERV